MPNPESFSPPSTPILEEPPVAPGSLTNQAREIIREKQEAAREAARRAAEAARSQNSLRRLLETKFGKAAMAVLAFLTITATTAGIARAVSAPQAAHTSETDGPETGDPAPQDQSADAGNGEQAPVDLDKELSNSETPWINDGYGEKGMYESKDKSWEYNFANASEVAEVCQNDARDMIIYTAENQSESFADYLAGLPEALQPEGFKNLSLSKTEAALENLSQKEYEAVMEHFKKVMSVASTRFVEIDGDYDNAFMSRKNPDGPFTHENMQLVQGPTYENHLTVTEFRWFDENGNEIGSMIAKLTPVFDEQGIVVGFEGCEQIVTKRGTRPHIYDVPLVLTPEFSPEPNPDPENPTPDPEKPRHDPKDPAAQIAAAGPLTPMEVDPAKANSEADHEKQEAINRYDLYAQAAALAQDAAVSEEVAKAQDATEDAMAAVERRMAEEAKAAAEAAAKAAAEAAAKQAAANAETARQQAAAEEAARRQAAADAAAAEQAPSGDVTAADFLRAAKEQNGE